MEHVRGRDERGAVGVQLDRLDVGDHHAVGDAPGLGVVDRQASAWPPSCSRSGPRPPRPRSVPRRRAGPGGPTPRRVRDSDPNWILKPVRDAALAAPDRRVAVERRPRRKHELGALRARFELRERSGQRTAVEVARPALRGRPQQHPVAGRGHGHRELPRDVEQADGLGARRRAEHVDAARLEGVGHHGIPRQHRRGQRARGAAQHLRRRRRRGCRQQKGERGEDECGEEFLHFQPVEPGTPKLVAHCDLPEEIPQMN